MFPPGSMTGAPKKRSVRLIHELEQSNRGIYSGSIGFLSLTGSCNFSVVIRTAVLNPGGMYLGVGGAIIYASDDQDEFDEMILKARAMLTPLKRYKIWGLPENPIYTEPSAKIEFDLLETLLFEKSRGGFFDLSLHLDRMEASAKYFGFDKFERMKVKKEIEEKEKEFESNQMRVRIVHSKSGTTTVQATILTSLPSPYLVQLARKPVYSNDPFLKHKTTQRNAYQSVLSLKGSQIDDVILYNEHGQITESTIANIAIQLHGKLVTPKEEIGLLPGTKRKMLLEQGEIHEGIITIQQVREAKEIILFNSVRGKFYAKLID